MRRVPSHLRPVGEGERSTKPVARPPTPTPAPPPAEGEFHASATAPHFCGAGDPLRLTKPVLASTLLPTRFDALGMPVWTSYEAAIMHFLVARGTGQMCTWTALRGGQMTVNKSLGFELAVHPDNVARAMARLKRRSLIEIGMNIKDRQSVRLTQRLHEFAIEMRWRAALRETSPDFVTRVTNALGWQRLLEAVDRMFTRRYNARHWDDRRTVLDKLAATYNFVAALET